MNNRCAVERDDQCVQTEAVERREVQLMTDLQMEKNMIKNGFYISVTYLVGLFFYKIAVKEMCKCIIGHLLANSIIYFSLSY